MSETTFLMQNIATFSYLGVFVVAMLANVIVIVPEEIILLALGYVAGMGIVNPFIVVPIVACGLLVTDIIFYTLSKRKNRFVMFLYEKLFAWKIKSRLPWIEKHVNKVLFFARFVIQLHLLGPLIAGQTKMPLKRFIAIELGALVIYASLLISLGVYFRDRIEFIISDIRIVHNIIFIVIGIAVLFVIFKFLRRIILGNPKKEIKKLK